MNVGDVVELKSGGLPMTIMSKNIELGNITYTCIWHDVNGHAQILTFHENLLRYATKKW